MTRRRLPVSWWTISLFAAVVAFADGFWLTSIQGAVGAIERREQPVHRWVRDSVLMLPVFFVGIVVALLLARRWVSSERGTRRAAVSLLLIIGVTFGIGMVEVAASSAYDYHLQVQHLEAGHRLQHATLLNVDSTPVRIGSATCDALCAARRSTLDVHIAVLRYAVPRLLLTNAILILWALALCGGRLWVAPKPTRLTLVQPHRVHSVEEALA